MSGIENVGVFIREEVWVEPKAEVSTWDLLNKKQV
jgi:hypothetical protein